MKFATYILKCSDHSFYTGWTNDIEKRLRIHNEGKGSRYTRARLPVELAYIEFSESRSAAMSREFAIKKLTRAEKLNLIKSSPALTQNSSG
jgi:putative endonuclease